MEGMIPVWHLRLAVAVVACALFTAGALFGYHWRTRTVVDLRRQLRRRDCLIADLRTRIRLLEPEANPLGWLEIHN